MRTRASHEHLRQSLGDVRLIARVSFKGLRMELAFPISGDFEIFDAPRSSHQITRVRSIAIALAFGATFSPGGSNEGIEFLLVDAEFTKRLFLHLRQTHDFDMFRQWAQEVLQKQTTQLDIISKQLEEIETQQETILDERLAIRTHINQRIKEALAADATEDSEKLRERFEKKAAPDIERLRKRAARLDEREKELKAKLSGEEDDQQVKTARTFADFQTELAQLAEDWEKKPLRDKYDFVSLLVEKTILSIVSTHWVQFIIHWRHPAWASETLYIRRKFGHFRKWTDEENEFLWEFYPNADKEMILSSMPHRTWSVIRNQSHFLGVKRVYRREFVGIDENTSWSDYQFFQALQIEPTSRETICIVGECTNSDPSL